MSAVDSVAAEATNAKAYSVSELAFALKRTVEDAYGFVRVRGEISKVTRHASGHIYLTIKDERACIDGVVWRTSARGLKCQPEQGLEVIVTGKVTTYPARSSYQLVIETMEPAGVGALLAQLERLKARLAAEGLFDATRKRPLPSTPTVVGVVTSPTGAVIRDILHRVRDRWPCHVVVWPVVVQGEAASAQVIAAIRGFNALDGSGPVPRPDVLIVARGGGSIEDLWPFNDEALARAAAASGIPLISAVGHETDTTLIDFASDRRAPTPTAAAEIATPILAELKGLLADFDRRMTRCSHHGLEARRTRLQAAARGLPSQADLLAIPSQRFDQAASRLSLALERNTAVHERDFVRCAGRLTPALLDRPRQLKAERVADLARRLKAAAERAQDAAARRARLPELAERLKLAFDRSADRAEHKLANLEKLRLSLDPNRPLSRGFARVHKADGALAHAAAELKPGEAVRLVFANDSATARVDGASAEKAVSTAKPAKPAALQRVQGDLF